MDLRDFALGTVRLSLKAVTAADEAESFAAVTPAVTRYMSFEPAASLAESAALTPGWLAQMAAGTDLHVTIRRRDTAEFLGRSGVHGIGGVAPTTGLWLKAEAQRRGYGRETVAALVAWAARVLGVAALRYVVVEENWPSRRLAESLGGVVVGAGRLVKPGGVEHPEVIYRIPAPPA